jgi:hypothetical protein
LQPKEQTAKAPSADPVREWMELMREWDALSAQLAGARAATAAGEASPDDAEAAVFAKMVALKQRIGAFLGEAARQRPSVSGPLVMGTLISPTDKQSAARRHAAPPSGEETD